MGEPLTVQTVAFDAPTALRLREMGIAPGARVTVCQRGGFGGRVIAVNQQRFALDGATAARIEAEPCGCVKPCTDAVAAQVREGASPSPCSAPAVAPGAGQ